MLNVLKEDQTLIQIKRLEKVQHIESAQLCTNGQLVTLAYDSLFNNKQVRQSEDYCEKIFYLTSCIVCSSSYHCRK